MRIVDRLQPGLDFLYAEDFLMPAACDALVACFLANAHLCAKDAPGNSFFDDRYMWFNSIPDSFRAEKALMQRTRHRAVAAVRDFFGEDAPLYSDTIQLVRWPPGPGMPAHADNSHPDNSPHNTPWRDYAGVIYLNDAFAGGEFFFEKQQVAVKIKKGLFVAFPGGRSHLHGVQPVRDGIRYTMPGWYTRDPRHEDAYARLDYEGAA